jgi:NAD(P)-dependent dehydrogenase (short-subunit alcohol dehydrogenase family)
MLVYIQPIRIKDKYLLTKTVGAQFDQLFTAGKTSERDMWNQSWNVNTTGTQIMTSTFIPLLLKSQTPRLLFVTSGTSTLAGAENGALPVDRSPPRGWPKQGFSIPAYRSAKCGMNMLMREWHRMLKEDDVKVWCISPGFLATGLGGNPDASKKMGAGDPAVAGPFIRSVIEGKRDADIGKVITKDGVQDW